LSGQIYDVSKWMKFNGEHKKWFRVNCKWISKILTESEEYSNKFIGTSESTTISTNKNKK